MKVIQHSAIPIFTLGSQTIAKISIPNVDIGVAEQFPTLVSEKFSLHEEAI